MVHGHGDRLFRIDLHSDYVDLYTSVPVLCRSIAALIGDDDFGDRLSNRLRKSPQAVALKC